MTANNINQALVAQLEAGKTLKTSKGVGSNPSKGTTIGRMKRPLTTSPHCQLGPKVMQERMKRELANRVDLFFDDLKSRNGRSVDQWMKEFAAWSMNKSF